METFQKRTSMALILFTVFKHENKLQEPNPAFPLRHSS